MSDDHKEMLQRLDKIYDGVRDKVTEFLENEGGKSMLSEGIAQQVIELIPYRIMKVQLLN